MKRYNLFLIFILFISSCHLLEKARQPNQDHDKDGPCASVPCSEEGEEELIDLYQKDIPDVNVERIFKIKAHIIQHNNDPTELNEAAVRVAIRQLNKDFLGANIHFDLAPEISKARSSHYLSDVRSDQLKEASITDLLDEDKTINLYLIRSNSLLAGYTPVLSHGFDDYANFNLNKLFLSHRAIQQAATVAHEFGHFFNLQHTFGDSPAEASTDELPDGSNCQFTGDLICDTPADPNGQQDCCDCSYLGTTFESNRNYNPLTNNFMSYYKHCCRDAFTPGQLKAIKMAALEYRGYLR